MQKFAGYMRALCVGSVLVSASAFAGSSNPSETARANTSTFINEATFGRTTCGALAAKGVAAGDTPAVGAELQTCLAKVRDEADRRFKLLPSVLGPNSDAMKGAKDYYAYWLASLAELEPKNGETREAYASRQSANAARLSELQSKLETALPQ